MMTKIINHLLSATLVVFCINSSAQIATTVIRRGCEHGSNLYSSSARIYSVETLRISSETDAHSPERISRLTKLEEQRDDFIGKIKFENKNYREQWIKDGMDRDVAELYWTAVNASLIISFSLAINNLRWDESRIALETQEKCQSSKSK